MYCMRRTIETFSFDTQRINKSFEDIKIKSNRNINESLKRQRI